MILIVVNRLAKFEKELLASIVKILKQHISVEIEIANVEEIKRYKSEDTLLLCEEQKTNKSKFVKEVEKVIETKIENTHHIFINKPNKIIENLKENTTDILKNIEKFYEENVFRQTEEKEKNELEVLDKMKTLITEHWLH